LKIATFFFDNQRMTGILDEAASTVSPFEVSVNQASLGIQWLIEREVSGQNLPATSEPIELDRVKLEAPVPRPRRNVFCVGKNYYDHAHEFSKSGYDSSAASGVVPSFPIVFSKVPESVIGPDDCIDYDPAVSESIDYEVELAVIIGKPGRNISKEHALDHVWGLYRDKRYYRPGFTGALQSVADWKIPGYFLPNGSDRGNP